ncbi:HTH_Tnp_Tc3_2 domain-containing protein [Trichonephila clavipes]|nr:HTH_Tnp_Tc3_2 domain-containing protein [Trichonephila clavipes]
MVDRKLAIGQTGKRQLALSVRGERWLRRIVGSQRSQTVRITNQTNDGASRTVSKRTVQYLLHRIGFRSHRPTRVPMLKARHRAAHLAWQESIDTGV